MLEAVAGRVWPGREVAWLAGQGGAADGQGQGGDQACPGNGVLRPMAAWAASGADHEGPEADPEPLGSPVQLVHLPDCFSAPQPCLIW